MQSSSEVSPSEVYSKSDGPTHTPSSLVVDFVDQSSNLLNLHPHVIPIIQHDLWVAHGSDPGARTRHDNGTLLQSSALRQKRNGLCNIEDHFSERGRRVSYFQDRVPGQWSVVGIAHLVLESCTTFPL